MLFPEAALSDNFPQSPLRQTGQSAGSFIAVSGAKPETDPLGPPCFFFAGEALQGHTAGRADPAPFAHDRPFAEKIARNVYRVKAMPVAARIDLCERRHARQSISAMCAARVQSVRGRKAVISSTARRLYRTR